MLKNKVRLLPAWAWHALACIFWWGLWGFLAKVSSESASPMQLQILFTLGMLPTALVALWQLDLRLSANRAGAACGIFCGLFTGLGMLAFYGAMQRAKASIVGPATALFPLLTILLAILFLTERINRIQMVGIVLAVCAIAVLSA